MSQADTNAALHLLLAEKLAAIEEDLVRGGAGRLTRLTLIVRDPTNDDAFCCVSNEPEGQMAEAFRVALGGEKVPDLTPESVMRMRLGLDAAPAGDTP